MYNYELLKEVGKKLLLKRTFSKTYNEWLSASEYIKQNDKDNIIMCERVIRAFEQEILLIYKLFHIYKIIVNYQL